MFKSKKKEKEGEEATSSTKVLDSKPTSGSGKGLSDGELAFVTANCGQPLYVCWIETIKDDSRELDKRILAISQFRIFQIKKSKIGSTKTVSKNVHFFEIKSVHCHSASVAKISYMQGDTLRSMEIHSPNIPDIIHAIRKAYRNISFGFMESDGFTLDLTEEKALRSLEQDYEPGPCCGFVETYRAWCDLLGEEAHEGLLRYIAYKGEAKEQVFDFNGLPGIEPHTATSVHMVAVTNTLRHNIHFNALVADGVVRKKMADQLSEVLMANRSITRLVLRGLHAGSPGWTLVGSALLKNPLHLVQVLDLSCNKLDGQGFLTLIQALKEWPHALHTLNMARCALTTALVGNLAVALRSNFGMSLTIRYIDLSFNKFGDTGSQEFCRWLVEMSTNSQLEYLAARDADVYLGRLAPALLNLKHLKGLDVRGCKLGTDALHLKELCVQTATLSTFALTSQTANHQELAKPVIHQYLRNPKIKQVTMRLTNITDHVAITGGLEHNKSLHTLDLTGCRFKENDMVSLVTGLIGCDSLEVLILDGCYQATSSLANKFGGGSDGRELSSALSALVASNPGIHHLSLADGYRKVITSFLQPMGSNSSIKTLDISRNDLGDQGGQALAGCLRTNKCLEHLECDENGFSTNAWLELRWCLEVCNTTLLTISYPWHDLKKYTGNEDPVLLQRYRELLEDINRHLRSNQYRKLGKEHMPERKKYGVQLTFDHDHTPLELNGWAQLVGPQADLQQEAMKTTITAEQVDEGVGMKSPQDYQRSADSFNSQGQVTPAISTTDVGVSGERPAEATTPPTSTTDLNKNSPEGPGKAEEASGQAYQMTEEEGKLFKPYDINAASDDDEAVAPAVHPPRPPSSP